MVCACVTSEEVFQPNRFDIFCRSCISPDSTAGPERWQEIYPIAAGERQSPIDISSDVVNPDPRLGRNPLKWHYPKQASVLVNTGYGWRVDVDGTGSSLKGGPLGDEYEIAQFHAHWGRQGERGSEHTVDGESFPAELHLVHWNTKYGTIEEALKHGDGLAVLGVFLVLGKQHPDIQKLVDMLPEVQYKDESVKLERPIDPTKLLPGHTGYWTYPGSLTTPPCSECVVWLVLREAIEVSEQQLEAFRNMCSHEKCDGVHETVPETYRSAQPIHSRCVRSSYV